MNECWLAIAKWKKSDIGNDSKIIFKFCKEKNSSISFHPDEAGAKVTASWLMRSGLDGKGEIFPIETKVERVNTHV